MKIQVLNIQGFAFDLAGEDCKQPVCLPLPPEWVIDWAALLTQSIMPTLSLQSVNIYVFALISVSEENS